jgi:16S rRNA (cytosine967-C5)-methyltransferase
MKSRPTYKFSDTWETLLTTSVHLDSLLYKANPKEKSLLARVLPAILMRPHTLSLLAKAKLDEGEPWSLTPAARATWRTSRGIFDWLESKLRDGAHIENLGVPGREEDFPPSMVEELKQSFGSEVAEELFRTLSSPPPLTLRACYRISPRDLIDRFDPSSLPVKIAPGTLSPSAVSLSSYAQILNTEVFREGLFEIQDEGSQVMAFFSLWPELFAPLLSKKPGAALRAFQGGLPMASSTWRVVDACAGAGGKSLALADALRSGGRVFSYDTVAGKLQALRKRASRAGYRSIQTVQVPEELEPGVTFLDGKFDQSADRVLVDAPCSGWGVLRRNPDIKWRQTPEELTKLSKLQLRLLETYHPLVAEGGILTFGVCTFRKAETWDVVAEFSQRYSDQFEPIAGGYLGPGPCDGFFMHAWTRKKSKA